MLHTIRCHEHSLFISLPGVVGLGLSYQDIGLLCCLCCLACDPSTGRTCANGRAVVQLQELSCTQCLPHQKSLIGYQMRGQIPSGTMCLSSAQVHPIFQSSVGGMDDMVPVPKPALAGQNHPLQAPALGDRVVPSSHPHSFISCCTRYSVAQPRSDSILRSKRTVVLRSRESVRHCPATKSGCRELILTLPSGRESPMPTISRLWNAMSASMDR